MIASYPYLRLRRLRQAPWIRHLCAETYLTPSDLILPLFLRPPTVPPDIPSMPGIQRYTIDELDPLIRRIEAAGIPAVALFPLILASDKTPDGAEAWQPDNLICTAIRAIKSFTSKVGVIADVALDPYTSHGHDGILKEGQLDNDLTVQALVRQSLNQARAGADILAPSDMMDGRIGAIRHALEEGGFSNCLILSYAVKYASAFYGPFRQAVGAVSLQGLNDKATYQLNPANTMEGLRKAEQDLLEGADMVIVKPGLPYLDIIHQVRQRFGIPTFAYQVSGEYTMIKLAAANRFIDEKKAFLEALISMKRAGATGILTYAALDVAQWIKS